MGRQPNRTRQALLGFLSWGPMSGYDIRKIVDGSISNFWQESYGRIYPMLAELAQDGLASMREENSPGGRPRKVYSITDAGRREFSDWLGQPAAPRPARNELLLKLFFGARTDRRTCIRLVEDFLQENEEEIARYEQIRERLHAIDEQVEDRAYWLMTLRYGLLETRAHKQWCEETLALLREETEDSP